MRGAEHTVTEEVSGTNGASLWLLIQEIAGRPGPSWVISPRALYSWTLLGLFERLLLGTIAIANDRPKRIRAHDPCGLGREPGLFFAADPPSAAALLLGEEKRRVTWVCAGNYGWQGMWPDATGLAACQLLAKAIAETSAALAAHSLGGWSVTVGSMALRAWRSQHMEKSLYVGNDERQLALLARSTFGGRIHVSPATGTRRGCYHVDARGLYCHLGSTTPLPCGCRTYRAGADKALDPGRLADGITVATVKIRNACTRFPVRDGQKVTYPLGNIETVLPGPELALASKLGLISEIGESIEYDMGTPLAGFERACRRMREACGLDSGGPVGCLSKGLAVALIGKLAAWDETWEDCDPDYSDRICGSWLGPDGKGGLTEWRALVHSVSRRVRAGLAYYALPEIPVWIWSAGRVWLWERIFCAGMPNVLYADTDGLVVTGHGYHRLCEGNYIRANEWGELRLVRGPVDVEIVGPKVIRIGDELIQAGAPREQRGTDFADKGYWYRRPTADSVRDGNLGYFEEEYRARTKNNP
jgi:hypothetical protein